MPKRISCHKAIVVITRTADCFHNCMYVLHSSCFCEVWAVCVVDHLWPLTCKIDRWTDRYEQETSVCMLSMCCTATKKTKNTKFVWRIFLFIFVFCPYKTMCISIRTCVYLCLSVYISFIFNLIKKWHQKPSRGGCN